MSAFKVFLDKVESFFFAQKAKHEAMKDTGFLVKFGVPFVKRFKPSKRIMFLLITRMKRSTSSNYTKSVLNWSSVERFGVCLHMCLPGHKTGGSIL